MKILAEDKAVEQKTTELLQEWEKKKPVQVFEAINNSRHVTNNRYCIHDDNHD